MKLVCPNCKVSFSTTSDRENRRSVRPSPLSRQPRILKCGHTFCDGCLQQMSKKIVAANCDEQFKASQSHFLTNCQLCQSVTRTRSGIKDLPVNIYLMAFIGMSKQSMLTQALEQVETFQSIQQGKAEKETQRLTLKKSLCKLCEIKSITCECVECGSVLCNYCFETVHKMSAALRHHKPVNLAKQPGSSQLEATCAQHNRVIEYLCQDDTTSICSKCYISGDHQGHSIISFEEKNKSVIEDIGNAVEKATVVLSKMKRVDNVGQSVLPAVRNETRTVMDHINESFLHMHALLQIRENELLEEVSSAFQDCVKYIEEQKETFLENKQNLELALDDGIKLLEDNGMILDGTQLLDRLSEALQSPCFTYDADLYSGENGLKWDESCMKDLTSAIEIFGNITGNMRQFKSKTFEEAAGDIDDQVSEVSSYNSSACPQSPVSTIGESCADTEGSIVFESDSDAGSVRQGGTSKSKDINLPSIALPLAKGSPVKVVITHIRSPVDFYVQLVLNKHKLETLAHNINIWCKSSTSQKSIPKDVEPGMLVLARFSQDKSWYRARVLDIVSSAETKKPSQFKVHVTYFDFGNNEVVPITDLRIMQSRFMHYPEFSVQCRLHNISPHKEGSNWDLNVIQVFHQMTEEKVLVMNPMVSSGSLWEVDLTCMPTENVSDDRFVSIRDMLIFLEVARFGVFGEASSGGQMESQPAAFKKVNFFTPTPLCNGEKMEVMVTSVESPSVFYILTMGDEHDYYFNMLQEMQQMYDLDSSRIYDLYCPRVDNVCAIKDVDGQWYRAKITSLSEKRKVNVFLPDLGKTVRVHCNKLKKLHNDFLKLPSQATLCSLVDVSPIHGDWSEEAKRWFKITVTGKCGQADIIRLNTGTGLVLWLANDKMPRSINYALVKNRFAQSTGLSSTEMLQSTLSLSSPWKSYARDRVSTQGSQANSQNSILKTPPSGQKSDYLPGQKSPVSHTIITSPQSKSSHLHPDSRKPASGSQSPNKRKALTKAELAPAVRKPAVRNVQLEIEKAMEPGEGGSDKSAKGSSLYIEVLISNYVSPTSFYIRVKDKEENLEQMMADLQKEYANSPVTSHEWKEKEYCTVRSPSNDLWYRASILRAVSPEEVHVLAVDYGYHMTVSPSDLRLLKKRLGNKMECAAVRCHLGNITPAGSSDADTWTRTAIEFMAEEIKNRKLFIKTEGEVTELGLPIDIILEEEVPETAFEPASWTYHSLRLRIIDQGLAMSAKSSSQSVLNGDADPFKREIYSKESPSPGMIACPDDTSPAIYEDNSKDSGNCSTGTPSPGSRERKRLDICEVLEEEGEIVPSFLDLPPAPALGEGQALEVIPTYVTMDGNIYVSPVKWEKDIQQIAQKLQDDYSSSKSNPSCVYPVGLNCVAFFQDDNNWYRAVIEDIRNDEAKVLYIDFGNKAWVPVSYLRPLAPELAICHILAYVCALDGLHPNTQDGQWTLELLTYIHQLCVNNHCLMTVMGFMEDGTLKVELKTKSGMSIGRHLVDKGYAYSASDLSETYHQSAMIQQVLQEKNGYPQLDISGLDDTFKAMVTHVELPNLVYLQRTHMSSDDVHDFAMSSLIAEHNSSLDQFEQLAQDIKSCSSQEFVSLPDVGLMCLGLFSFDMQWYRALCVEKYPANDSCLVIYVDYGNSEIVPRSRLASLPSEFWEVPAQALRCHFNIVPPSGPLGFWKRDSLNAVVHCLAQKELIVKVLKLSPMTVELMVEEGGEMRLAYESLVSSGLALLPSHISLEKLGKPGSEQASEDEEADVIIEDDDDVIVEVDSDEEAGCSNNSDYKDCTEELHGIALTTELSDAGKAVEEEGKNVVNDNLELDCSGVKDQPKLPVEAPESEEAETVVGSSPKEGETEL